MINSIKDGEGLSSEALENRIILQVSLHAFMQLRALPSLTEALSSIEMKDLIRDKRGLGCSCLSTVIINDTIKSFSGVLRNITT